MSYHHTVAGTRYRFSGLKTLLAKASPLRSGDVLAGVAAEGARERVAAQRTLADLPLTEFLRDSVIPYETDEVTRLIADTHDDEAFRAVAHLTVGGFRDWLLSDEATSEWLAALAPGLTPEMAAAVSKVMRLQDLILVGAKCRVVTHFRTTIGLEGRLSTRIQPNHPTDDPKGIVASALDGLMLGGGDAVIGINPATDSVESCVRLVTILDELRQRLDMPVQSCVLAHVTTTMEAMRRGAPVDLVFQSIAGTEAANRGFGIDLALLAEAREMALALRRGTVGDNVMYFETGQGSALSADAHHGVDQQTVEARAYAVARHFQPLLVNTVVGFIGPEYLYNGKQITRAGLEDHFCGKLLGVPMGCDVCYTNHAEADQDDMDALLTLLGAAGCSFIMGVPGADDIMLNYQSTSFHDALYVRRILNKRPAPEFEAWLERIGLFDARGNRLASPQTLLSAPMESALQSLDGELAPSGSGWDRLRAFTQARIGIEPVGISQPTSAHLAFQDDHAQARDAVHAALDADGLRDALAPLAVDVVELRSLATGREEYLQRPDLGRRLSEDSRAILMSFPSGYDIAFTIADGLSATAVNRHAAQVIEAVLPLLREEGLTVAPVSLLREGRVAAGDDVAVAVGAQIAVMLIGERPGLTSPDSLGVYVTWQPRPDTRDSERNCISNVRPEGLSPAEAARKLLSLLREARRRRLTGVALKEDAGMIE
jgi:ethanolamine ammonia-lyase large subunit